MAYLLDSNVFIQAKNLHYGFDFCPGFWDWLLEQNKCGKVLSIDKVLDELEAGEDELATWATAGGLEFFLPLDPTIIPALGQLSEWIIKQNYRSAAKNAFFQVADYYLIAYALAYSHTVITHEIPANSDRKVKIPNVCLGLGIKVMSPYEMLRKERARFILGPTLIGTSFLQGNYSFLLKNPSK